MATTYDHTMKRFDTDPEITYTVVDDQGVAVDLSGATVTFTMASALTLKDALSGIGQLTITVVNKRWLAMLVVGDTLRLEYGNLNEDLTVASIDYETGELICDRGGSPNPYYEKGSKLIFTIVDKSIGAISGTENNILNYSWSSADTAKIGIFDGEFEVTKTGGEVQSYPSSGYLSINISEDLDNS